MNKITKWFAGNKLAASLLASLILGTLILGFLAYQAWDDYGTASADYTSKASQLVKLSQTKPFPSQDNLSKLEATITTEQSSLDALIKDLKKYQVPTFADIGKAKLQDRPQRFQDALRNEVTRIKSLAASTGATLPPGFYLGLDEYENRLPSQDDVRLLSKQLTVLSWLGELLATHKDLILSEFSRSTAETLPKKTPPALPVKVSTPYENACSMKLSFRCNQGSFREIVNTISTAPYFLIIDQLLVHNTSSEPPRRDTPPPTVAPAQDGSTPVQRLPIIVGRELLDISLKLRGLEFPDQESSAATNLQLKPSDKVKGL
ncbi:MAG: Amuc_1100 family pilus-like protein [Verrucomicrobia bacterium]|nr:Amuc_1100 family pilus-like protein [Verrucomicrobiota bacterium]